MKRIERLGVEVVDVPLIKAASAPYLDDERLAEALLSFVQAVMHADTEGMRRARYGTSGRRRRLTPGWRGARPV